ncbi:putative NAD/FAD-binding protein [Rhodovulum iodosum]|uniref:NAD/FAD-binding protein n=1 Tax=Rhodovulum iodosum TaxID=68291 RepID=A0ABV3XQU8_9RHOB|nr:FAD-dependent oxidoreductase [Rhodovulum robiginosum]RSK32892.1 cyclopropane-fatty-acyl-phospholipid synthase [Rhodovulum robiginosum]
MPFEYVAGASRRIAVIGAGVSGLGAAHLLARDHRVVLYEAEGRLGGHARTVIAGKRGDQPVDTGFIVFNYANYPHLTRLFDELGVPVAKSDMSFGASLDGGRFEYGLRNLRAVFAQPANIANRKFLRMLRDVVTFNGRALEVANDPTMTIGEFLDALGTGDWFRDRYLLPLSGAIWSTPSRGILEFPAQAMIRFFENHALLSHSGQHQWYTVEGGSVEYVRRLEIALARQGVETRLKAPVQAVRRAATGVDLRAAGGDWESFDEVVFACHSDQALTMLAGSDATEEVAALSDIRYQPNEAVLHADTALMPKRRAAWASWVYTEETGKASDRIDLTYWMNSLQPIPADDPLFVTLNSQRPIREELIHDTVTFDHPVYDLAAMAAQGTLRAMNGGDRLWFCGAWMKNGFHEDGLASAVDVAEAMTRRARGAVAA